MVSPVVVLHSAHYQESVVITEGIEAGFPRVGLKSANVNPPDAAFGSVNPAAWNIKGHVVEGAYYQGADAFYLIVNSPALLPQDLFYSITPEDDEPLIFSAASSFTYDGTNGNSIWRWTIGVSTPARWDGTGTSTIIVTA